MAKVSTLNKVLLTAVAAGAIGFGASTYNKTPEQQPDPNEVTMQDILKMSDSYVRDSVGPSLATLPNIILEVRSDKLRKQLWTNQRTEADLAEEELDTLNQGKALMKKRYEESLIKWGDPAHMWCNEPLLPPDLMKMDVRDIRAIRMAQSDASVAQYHREQQELAQQQDQADEIIEIPTESPVQTREEFLDDFFAQCIAHLQSEPRTDAKIDDDLIRRILRLFAIMEHYPPLREAHAAGTNNELHRKTGEVERYLHGYDIMQGVPAFESLKSELQKHPELFQVILVALAKEHARKVEAGEYSMYGEVKALEKSQPLTPEQALQSAKSDIAYWNIRREEANAGPIPNHIAETLDEYIGMTQEELTELRAPYDQSKLRFQEMNRRAVRGLEGFRARE